MPADILVLPYQRSYARFSIMGINSCGCWFLAFKINSSVSNNVLSGVTKCLEHQTFQISFLKIYINQKS